MPSSQTQMTQFDPNKVQLENPYEIGSVYANNSACMQAALDFRIIFSEIVMDSLGKPPRLELRANVIMSPKQAKLLLATLSESVKIHEAQFGPIVLPQQPVPPRAAN